MKKRKWSNLTKQQMIELSKFASSIGVPPQFVSGMYENNQIELPSNIKY